MEEQELSLRELIEVLLNYKMLIIGITVFCVIVSGIVSFFVLSPSYEAQVKLLVSDLKRSETQIEGINGFLDNLSQYPDLNIESYKDQIRNPEILNKTIQQLNLNPEKYTIASLAESISIENTKGSNILKIKVKNKDPQLAADIANTVAANFVEFITQLSKRQASKSLEYIENQLRVEEENLNNALLEYKKFLQQPRGVSELESEQSSKISLLTRYKEKLAQLDMDIKVLHESMKETEEQLQNVEKYIVTRKSIADDPLMMNAAQSKNNEFQETIGLELESQEVNPIYIELKRISVDQKLGLTQKSASRVELINKISQTQRELEQLQVELADKKHQNDILTRQVNMAQKTYNALMDKYEESRIVQSGKVGDSAVVISSKAYKPEKPVSPKKSLNIAIAGVLGIMLGVFIAFFKEYWENTTEPPQASKSTDLS